MKAALILVGKTQEKNLISLTQDYLERLSHYLSLEVIVLSELRGTKSLSQDQQKQKEAQAILKVLSASDHVILLDERGDEMTSMEFAQFMKKKMNTIAGRLVFIIGGPYGFDGSVYDRSNGKMSLSRMTFSHQMVRLIFIEQLYRAMSILGGSPYHHE